MRLQFAQRTALLLPLLLTAPSFLINASILPLLLFVGPGYPGPRVPARVGPWVIWGKVHRHGGLVVVGEAGQQLLDHVGPAVRQVLPLERVGGDVEEPGGLWRGRGPLQVPPATQEGGENLRIRVLDYFIWMS